MHFKDSLASIIAFLFAQDRAEHPPPAGLKDKILQAIKKQKMQ